MCRPTSERDPSVNEVDDGRDDQRSGQYECNRQHGAGAGRSDHDDEHRCTLGDGKRAEMPSQVCRAALLIALNVTR